jgi:hypothetical protein
MSPELFASILGAVVGGVVGILGACLGAWYTQWLQSRSERIKVLDKERVYVELSAIKRDAQGQYFIPGHGQILQSWEDVGSADPLREMPEIVQLKGKVALICYDRTAAASSISQYVIGRIVPL